MAGTKEGGQKARDTNKHKYGDDHYAKLGKLGGSVEHPETRAFHTNRKLARYAGYKGGIVTGDQYKTRSKNAG